MSDPVEIIGKLPPDFSPRSSDILSPEALRFIGKLQRQIAPKREKALQRRAEFQSRVNSGKMPEFGVADLKDLRKSDWKVATIPHDLLDRRVEITGPVERKMIINALNSGAKVYMADFEDSHSPTWSGTIQGQINLFDAVRRTITFESNEGKKYSLKTQTATLMVRPRGWHLLEKHALFEGQPVSASLFDFGLYFFHNAKALIERGTAPYFYLPKMESHIEARIWNDVFILAQKELGIPYGTIRATALIETLPAAFEMDEILYELKDHSAGLNCGRWDYIFSFIKSFSLNPKFVLPDRAQVTMSVPFLRAYTTLLIQTCHRRGAHAMGGMAAQIPIKDDPVANQAAIQKVIEDKEREVKMGHDGTWVAHPGLVETAMRVFDAGMRSPNQIANPSNLVRITPDQLLTIPEGTITAAGFKINVNVALLYLESWLSGHGCVPLYHLMEDAATAEISRAQIWQWIKHHRFTLSYFHDILSGELTHFKSQNRDPSKLALAASILDKLTSQETFEPFLTIPAYEFLD